MCRSTFIRETKRAAIVKIKAVAAIILNYPSRAIIHSKLRGFRGTMRSLSRTSPVLKTVFIEAKLVCKVTGHITIVEFLDQSPFNKPTNDHL